MSDAVLSLGSNIGDRAGYLAAAVRALGDDVRAVSEVYRTPPWGGVEQDDFYNVVVLVDGPDDEHGAALLAPPEPGVDDDDPWRWLTVCRELENAAGRQRGVRWGPRTLDADVIAVGSGHHAVVSDDPELTLPHPRAHERAFVLVPWAELDPGARLPGYGPIADLLDAMDTRGIVRLGPLDEVVEGEPRP